MNICFGMTGSTGGLIRSFVLLTGEAMTRDVNEIPGKGGPGVLPCHIRSMPSPSGLVGLDRFVIGFNCGLGASNSGRSVDGNLGGLLGSVRKGGRRGLVRAISLHTVVGTHCDARGVKRCNLTFSCCARFASPVHHCPSIVIRHLLAHCTRNKQDIGRSGCRRLYRSYDTVRRLTTKTRHTDVGCGRIRFVDSGLKRRFRNAIDNIARFNLCMRVGRGGYRKVIPLHSLSSSCCRFSRHGCYL